MIAGEKVTVPAVLQGFISQTQGINFWLDDVKVNTNINTAYINGENTYINKAVNVEVQGQFDAINSQIQAHSIRFTDERVEITFPVQAGDVVMGESVTLLGNNFKLTPQSKDNANVLSVPITQPFQLQIQGFVDTAGVAYISPRP